MGSPDNARALLRPFSPARRRTIRPGLNEETPNALPSEMVETIETQLAAEEARVCILAGASRINLDDWRDFVGKWLAELAFSDLKDNDGEVL